MKIISKNNKKELSLWKNPISWKLIVLVIIMPIVTTFATSVIHSPFKNFTASNDWIGFFGSYMGSIIGGLITLVVMYATIQNGDENLKKTMNQNEKIQNQNNRLAFCNDIATIISEFCGSTRALSVNLRKVNQLFKIYTHWNNEYINRIDKLKEYKNKKDSIKSTEIEVIMEKDIKSTKERLDTSKSEHMNALNNLSMDKPITTLFLLKIKLKGIDEAKELLEKVIQLNKEIDLYTSARDINQDIIKDIQKLDLLVEEILAEATKFIKKYSQS